MEYIAIILVVVAAIAISTAYYLYELHANMQFLSNRVEWLTSELGTVRSTLNMYVRGKDLRQNETDRPTRKTSPKTLNTRRKDNQ